MAAAVTGLPDSNPGKRPDADQLRAIIDAAVADLCMLAEEIQLKHPEIAERIWDLTNERLEIPVKLR